MTSNDRATGSCNRPDAPRQLSPPTLFWTTGEPWNTLRDTLLVHTVHLLHSILFNSVRLEISGHHNMPFDHRGQPQGGALLICWHCNMLVPLYLLQNLGVTALVSPSREGVLASRLFEAGGWNTMHGSSRHPSGIGSVRRACQLLQEGGLFALAPDGPLGPSGQVHAGLVYLASVTGVPIIPAGMAARHPWRLRTWDRMVIPRPFDRVHCHVAQPVTVPPNLSRQDIAVWQQRINDALNAAEAMALQLLAAPPATT